MRDDNYIIGAPDEDWTPRKYFIQGNLLPNLKKFT